MSEWMCTQRGASGGRGLQGLHKTIRAVCTDGQRHKDSPKNPKRRLTRLCNDALQRGCTCTAGLERKTWTVARRRWGQRGHKIQALATPPDSPDANISIYHSDFFTFPRVCHKRPFKSSHQRNRSYSHFTALHQLNEVSKKDVSVPLAETLSVIGHLQQRRPERKRPQLPKHTRSTGLETAGELMMKSEWK